MERVEERHERERGEKCSDSSSLLNRDFFSLATMSHCFSEEGERGKTTGIVECMSLIHYPHFLLFKTSPVIIVVLTYINTTVISFGKRSTYDIYPQQGKETLRRCICLCERDVCVYTLWHACVYLCVCGALMVYTRNCTLNPLQSTDHLTSWLALHAYFTAPCQICYPTVLLNANKNLKH